MSDLAMNGGPHQTTAPLLIIVRRQQRFELALTRRQQLLLRWLVANAGVPVRETELAQLAFGVFDPEPARPVSEEISAIALLLSSIVGANAIKLSADRTYLLEQGEFEFIIIRS